MKAHRKLILGGLAVMLSACSATKSPTAVPDSGLDVASPRYGVMYGSGNRTEGDEGADTSGTENYVQNTMAADSNETTATIAGGVMYGSGN
jgi:hypothetical protein